MVAHILVVEDSRTQAEAIRAVLESAGYEVELAESGEKALAQFDPERCHVVISDVMMPGTVDGYALCRRIKQSPGGRHTPVMLLTSLASPMDIIHGLASGADNFLTKPYDPDHLVERLQVLLRTREARAQRKLHMGIDIYFMGQTFNITSDREQILDLLISTFEDAVRQNQALRQREEELMVARAELARYAETLEARLESVLRSVPDVLFSVKADLTSVYYFSPACTEITGYEPDQFMRDPAFAMRLVHPNDVAQVAAAFQRAQAGERVTCECRWVHRLGGTKWLHTTVVPVRDDAERVVRLDGIARDITESRRLEEQFRQAQKMESVGRLAGGVAHDFNNLLTVVLGEAEFALEGMAADDPGRGSLEQIRAAGQRAAGLTRQLLAFSRQQIVEPSVFNINALVVEMDKMLRRLIGENIDLATRPAPELGLVNVDRGQLEQVLMNLVVNSRDAMNDGGRITIETANVDLDAEYRQQHGDVAPGEYVMLAVSDSGTGMSEETKSRLFEPFFTTKDREKGTGLGLATCYGIVKQAGGLIVVYSEEGVGTTMKVLLPRAHDVAAPAVRRAPAPIGGHEGILVLEDEEAVRRLTVRMLQAQGYRVVSTASGEEALAILEAGEERVQLLLTDVVLAGRLNGGVVAARARALRPELKVLFTSGYTSDVTILHGMLDEGIVLVQKPFTGEALGRKVREVLDTR
ncbi:MAG TPA: response regulator [Gemmatimonadaceae bacterium]|nr:response regulator [Gemmatimonadaceae bacterium]